MQRVEITKIRDFARRLWTAPDWQKLRLLVVRQRFSAILIAVGVGLLCYVGSEYWAMYHEQQALRHEWIEQQNKIATVGSNATSVKDDGLTRVSIPKINLDLIVVEGTSHKALRIGPGHLKNTPAPGELGNSVISAHRDTFFRHIYELTKGDEIQVRRNGHIYTFQVTGRKIVEPSDISILRNTPDARLTLVTCYPTYYIGPAPQRLIVFAKLIGSSEGRPQQAQAPATALHGS